MRGRRPNPERRMRRYLIRLSLHPVVDAALIAALESAPPGQRAALVRAWLRSGSPSPASVEEDPQPDLSDLGIDL